MQDNDRLKPKEGNFPCTWLSIEMNYPKTKGAIEDFYFYLYHKGIEVFIGHDGEWYLAAKSRCAQLSSDNRCLAGNRQCDECLQHGHGVKDINDAARFRFRNEYELTTYLKERRPALFKKLHPDTQKLAGKKPPKKKKTPMMKAELTLDPEHACFSCDTCCSYLNLVVDKPNDEDTVRSLLGYIYHEEAEVYHDNDGDWSLLLNAACENLGPHGLCTIYERRPSICRNFSADGCHGSDMNVSVKALFIDDRSLMQYLERKRPGLFKKLSPQVRKLAAGRRKKK